MVHGVEHIGADANARSRRVRRGVFIDEFGISVAMNGCLLR